LTDRPLSRWICGHGDSKRHGNSKRRGDGERQGLSLVRSLSKCSILMYVCRLDLELVFVVSAGFVSVIPCTTAQHSAHVM